ncbi:hypothetical protein [Streptacidiphilus rugosus]|uniref:hypothetical protein n=1 Tax=Streptacidiphilus rugosus TaxID=405783 RepID=UPI00055DC80A|nr:hypothetical protein [Streptacidiphilus rugosus]
MSSLFPSPSASGSRHPSSPASEDPERPRASHHASASAGRSATALPTAGGDAVPAQDGQVAVQPGPTQPDRPQTSVPPPLGPQAILPAEDGVKAQVAADAQRSGVLGPRGRLLGVGLALIGSGAALFGWRIRRL